MKKCLIVVDCQNDFVDQDGAQLGVKDGLEVIKNINKIMTSDYDMIIATQDWHPTDHVSLCTTFDEKPFSQRKTFQGPDNIEIEQMMWPSHCIKGTWGSKLHPELHQTPIDVIFRKGWEPTRECYSVFNYVTGTPTPYFWMVKAMNFEEITVVGLAADYCVRQTAIAAKDLAPTVRIIRGCTASVSPDFESVIEDIKKDGILIV